MTRKSHCKPTMPINNASRSCASGSTNCSRPPECMQLHHAYDQALLAHINAIASLKQRIATKDLAGATLGGLTFQRQIDNALGVADKELAAVCQRYGIPKFFTIISIPRWSD